MKKHTIMIIDDQEDFRNVLSDYLIDEGYAVTQACDGVEALHGVKFNKPHIILLDIAIPKINGFEVCRALKADHATKDIPIIFITAKNNLHDKLTGYIAGGQRYLCKPLDLAELEKWIRLLLHYSGSDEYVPGKNEVSEKAPGGRAGVVAG